MDRPINGTVRSNGKTNSNFKEPLMKEYKPQLRVSADDLCSATTLGSTVIGILFEKKGTEVKQAISARLKLIDEKITQYQTVTTKIEDFIEKKRKVLKELDLFYQGKCDDREALIAPFKRQMEEIWKKCNNTVFDFNKKTYKDLSKRAVTFEDGFEQFKSNFDDLDEFLKKEETVVSEIKGVAGLLGPTGATGYYGVQGATGLCGINKKFYAPSLSTDFLNKPGKDSIRGIGYGDRVNEVEEEITDDEDSAMSKMETLRKLLQKYVDRVGSLKHCIERLRQEKRSLTLILKNVDDTREYKLDLNKLSAFGFEDLE
jgi:predicted RNase H-like nuclease (RuvC/YqgF family)